MPDSITNTEELIKEIEMLKQQLNEMSATAHEMIKSQSHLESVLHNAGEGVILFNSDGTIKSLNLAAQNILGYQEVELMYQFAPQVFNAPEKYHENVPAYLKHYLTEHPDTFKEPLPAHHSKGHELPLHISISEVSSSDMVFFDDFSDEEVSETVDDYELFACIFRDLSSEINAKKILEEKNAQLEHAYISLSEHDRMRSEFLAKISHELLTPLNGIIGMADLLQEEVNKDQQEFVHVIRELGLRLESIISNILTFDKNSERGVEKTQFDLLKLLNGYEEKFKKILLTKKLGLSIEIENTELIPTFFAQYEHLQHILENLIDNALKFTESGGVHIYLKVLNHGKTSRKIVIAIQDTGIGISEADQEKIFHPFTQLEDTVTRQFGGVGMGLAIVKQLLENMQGTLNIKSQPGLGTTMTVTLILETAQEQLLDHALVEEEKLRQLKHVMEDDFNLLIETSISELHKHNNKLQEHIEKQELKSIYASCTMLKNIAEQFGAQYLIKIINDASIYFAQLQPGEQSKSKNKDCCQAMNEEIMLIEETLKSYIS